MNVTANDAVLAGVRVVDATKGIAGSVAALLLAEAGADVVKLEPDGGSTDRSLPGFRTWNRSKRSVVANLDGNGGRERLEQLLDAADVLIHNEGPTRAAQLGIDDVALAKRHPHLIVCSVLAWPANHAKADRPVDELLAMAELGLCDEQLPIDRDGPVYVRAPIGNWVSAYLASIAIVARLLVRYRTGVAGPAHTSLVQGMLVPMGMHWSDAQNPSDGLRAGMSKEGRGSQWTMFECGDGEWIHVMPPGPDRTPLMQSCLAEMGPDAVARANEATAPGAVMMLRAFPNLEANRVAFRMHPRARWLDELWSNDVPAQPCARFGEVLLDEQAAANNYTMVVDDPEVGRITTAGLPLTITPPARVAGLAPTLGAHTDEVLEEWTSQSFATMRDTTVARSESTHLPDAPLRGMKVLDLGNFLAGPYATQVLADLGANVIKLEMTTGDPMRPGDWAFAGCQRGKRSLALDLKAPDAEQLLARAVKWADVVHHNLRLPASERLGVHPDQLRSINANAIICHTSSYGPLGPRRDWPGYDQMFQALCGWEQFGAGVGNIPMWLRFGFMDHLCAISSVLSTLLACYRRERTGVASEVRSSLLGAGLFTNSETYVHADGTFAPVAVLDRAQRCVSIGRRIAETSDGWIAICADSKSDVDALLHALDLANDADESPLIAAIAARSTAELLTALSGAGVVCGPLNLAQKSAFFRDADNIAAGLVASYEHAEWGRLRQPGALWHFGDLSLQHHLAPPTLGQHSRECLAEFGLDDATIDDLVTRGVVVQYALAE